MRATWEAEENSSQFSVLRKINRNISASQPIGRN